MGKALESRRLGGSLAHLHVRSAFSIERDRTCGLPAGDSDSDHESFTHHLSWSGWIHHELSRAEARWQGEYLLECAMPGVDVIQLHGTYVLVGD